MVLVLIADYHTNEAIASRLGITRATVKREVEELRQLTGCRSKRELARWWLRHGDLWKQLQDIRNKKVIRNGPIRTFTDR
jgi:hypothetical protein